MHNIIWKVNLDYASFCFYNLKTPFALLLKKVQAIGLVA